MDIADKIIESGTDTYHHPSIQMIFEFVHPIFLFWSTQGNPNDVRRQLIDHGNDMLSFAMSQGAEWGTVASNDIEIQTLDFCARFYFTQGVPSGSKKKVF